MDYVCSFLKRIKYLPYATITMGKQIKQSASLASMILIKYQFHLTILTKKIRMTIRNLV